MATIVVALVTAYVGAGVIFATLFVVLGVSRVDERAAGAGWGFRTLIFPGAVLLWPILTYRWAHAARMVRP